MDHKRFTDDEWLNYLNRKVIALKLFMERIAEKESCKIQAVIVCEDAEDFRKIGTIACNVFPEQMMEQIYYTSEGAMKGVNYDIEQSLVRITSMKQAGEIGQKVPASVSSQLAYKFF